MKNGAVTLRSLEIAGFKSFAKRTKLEFGKGLIAIVGPNGSGKSNIVDAIKWVFGEQKTKLLRTEKSEDLIYHGNNGRARASMAEVILTLDNSAGKIPIELQEIEITRRLYRSGESNYLLNGKKISLSSIQELLAKSGFGVGSYTVVGQGLIEKLILTTGQGRKELFEEASGIKQFEIKQHQTKKKIEATKKNLDQINSMIREYSPQQADLAKQAKLLSERESKLVQLEDMRINYLSFEQTSLDHKSKKLLAQIDNYSHSLKVIEIKLDKLEKNHKIQSKKTIKSSVDKLVLVLNDAEKQRTELDLKITQLRVDLEQANLLASTNAEDIKNIESQIKGIKSNLDTHRKARVSIQKQIDKQEARLKSIDAKVGAQTKILDQTQFLLSKTQKTEYLKHSLGLVDILQSSIEAGKNKEQLAVIFFKLRQMIRHSIGDNPAELALKVGRIQNSISVLLGERDRVVGLQTGEVIKLRASELDETSIIESLKALQQQWEDIQAQRKQNKKSLMTERCRQLKQLEAEKNNLLKIINKTNQQLTLMATTQNDESEANYYTEHEDLTNSRILLEQQHHAVDLQLQEVEYSLSELKGLENRWFARTLRPIAQPVRVDLGKIRSLEAELFMLKDIDPSTEASYRELVEKLSYLNSQAKDLQGALKNLESVLNNTQAKIQKQFKLGFEKINKNFDDSFRALFGGGEARLELLEDEDGHGIEIMVQLPGKRTQNLSSLSGGEKALASASLLAGILASNPSPFVVLDEVDTALDESNTKKFAELLTTITKHSQVLVVTHNHDTMTAADELLGVTTTGNNESHIINVKINSLPISIAT